MQKFLGTLLILFCEAVGILKTLAASLVMGMLSVYYLYDGPAEMPRTAFILSWMAWCIFFGGASELIRMERVYYLFTGRIAFEEKMRGIFRRTEK